MIADIAAAVAQAARRMNRYPDREAWDLRADLARYLGHGLTAEQVWAANGSNEVITQVLQAFGGPGRTLLSFTPTYSMYPEYARNTHTRYVTQPRRSDFRIDVDEAGGDASPSCSPTWSSSPAPTIRPAPPSIWRRSGDLPRWPQGIAGHRRGLLRVRAVRDAERPRTAARVPSARGDPDDVQGVRVRRRSARLPGRRVRQLVDALRIVRLPYHLSAVTQAVARVALAHADEMLTAVDALRAERDDLAAWLAEPGWRSPNPTPTSSSSAGSPIGTGSGRVCWTAGCSSGKPDPTAGCGCRPAPRPRWRRSVRL